MLSRTDAGVSTYVCVWVLDIDGIVVAESLTTVCTTGLTLGYLNAGFVFATIGEGDAKRFMFMGIPDAPCGTCWLTYPMGEYAVGLTKAAVDVAIVGC